MWAPESTESPTASASSWIAASTICSGVLVQAWCRRPPSRHRGARGRPPWRRGHGVEAGFGHDDTHWGLSHGRRLAPGAPAGSGVRALTWAAWARHVQIVDLLPSYVRLEPATVGEAMPQSIRRLRTPAAALERPSPAVPTRQSRSPCSPVRSCAPPPGSPGRRVPPTTSWAARHGPCRPPRGSWARPSRRPGSPPHVALYPWGLVVRHGADSQHGYRVEHLPPVQRGLVHLRRRGRGGRRSCWCTAWSTTARSSPCCAWGCAARVRRVTTMNYSPLTTDVRAAAAQLAEEVEALVAETGYERIHVVGPQHGA